MTAPTPSGPIRRRVRMDQGVHRPAHQERGAARVPGPVRPTQGPGNAAARRREAHPDFRRRRRQQAAVASASKALQAHGLDRCPDQGRDGCKRDVALAVVGRNRQRLGALLLATAAERAQQPAHKPAA